MGKSSGRAKPELAADLVKAAEDVCERTPVLAESEWYTLYRDVKVSLELLTGTVAELSKIVSELRAAAGK